MGEKSKKQKPVNAHHKTILSENSEMEEVMEVEDAIKFLQGKRDFDKLDKSVDKGETTGSDERKPQAAKKGKTARPALKQVLDKL